MCRHPRNENSDGKTDYEFVTNWPAVTGALMLSFSIVAIPTAGSFFSDSHEESVRAATTSDLISQPFLKREAKVSSADTLAEPVAERPNNDVAVATFVAKPAPDVTGKQLASEEASINLISASEPPLVNVATGDSHHSPNPTADQAKPAVDRKVRDRSHASMVVTQSRPVGKLAWLAATELDEHLLAHSTELHLESVHALSEELLAATGPRERRRIMLDRKSPSNDDAGFSSLYAVFSSSLDPSDLVGLPLRRGAGCLTDTQHAKVTQVISRMVRVVQAEISRSVPSDSSRSHVLGIEKTIVDFLHAKIEENGKNMIPVLVQMLQVEKEGFRHALIDLLQSIDGPEASMALARRALYEMSSEVRSRALEALKSRPRNAFRQILVDGLRYPWPPVARRAAAALAALDDKEAAAQLAELLDKPDPRAPFQDSGEKWVVRELVCVNHLRNCLLCHALSTSRADLIRAPIPSPGRPLPHFYYARSRGPLVRADVVYLKQDFSTIHTVEDHGAWPKQQRFDYFVRTRPATDEELATVARDVASQDVAADEPATILDNSLSYPQREAVLYALRKLTSGSAPETRDR